MPYKQIGELDTLESIPVDAKGIVVDNHNDPNLVPMEAVLDGISGATIDTLNTHDKTLSGAINELYAFATGEFWVGTQAQYNNLEEHETKPYLITDAPVLLWVGSQEDYDALSTYSQNTLYVIV